MTRRPTKFSSDFFERNAEDLVKLDKMTHANTKDGPKSHAIEFGVGSILGIGSAYLDDSFTEPIGLIVGGGLALAQVLDHFEVIHIPWQKDVEEKWSEEPGLSRFQRILASTADFAMKNTAFNGGFATGYLLAQTELGHNNIALPKRRTTT